MMIEKQDLENVPEGAFYYVPPFDSDDACYVTEDLKKYYRISQKHWNTSNTNYMEKLKENQIPKVSLSALIPKTEYQFGVKYTHVFTQETLYYVGLSSYGDHVFEVSPETHFFSVNDAEARNGIAPYIDPKEREFLDKQLEAMVSKLDGIATINPEMAHEIVKQLQVRKAFEPYMEYSK